MNKRQVLELLINLILGGFLAFGVVGLWQLFSGRAHGG